MKFFFETFAVQVSGAELDRRWKVVCCIKFSYVPSIDKTGWPCEGRQYTQTSFTIKYEILLIVTYYSYPEVEKRAVNR